MTAHVNYPHEPGRLYDCPACEEACHCTDEPGADECIYDGPHRFVWVTIVDQQDDQIPSWELLYDIDGVVWSLNDPDAMIEHLAQWDYGDTRRSPARSTRRLAP